MVYLIDLTEYLCIDVYCLIERGCFIRFPVCVVWLIWCHSTGRWKHYRKDDELKSSCWDVLGIEWMQFRLELILWFCNCMTSHNSVAVLFVELLLLILAHLLTTAVHHVQNAHSSGGLIWTVENGQALTDADKACFMTSSWKCLNPVIINSS